MPVGGRRHSPEGSPGPRLTSVWVPGRPGSIFRSSPLRISGGNTKKGEEPPYSSGFVIVTRLVFLLLTPRPDLWTTKELRRYAPAPPTPWPSRSAAWSVTRGFPAPCGFTVMPSCCGTAPAEAFPDLHAAGCARCGASWVPQPGCPRGTEDPSFLSSHLGSLQLPAGLPRKRKSRLPPHARLPGAHLGLR